MIDSVFQQIIKKMQNENTANAFLVDSLLKESLFVLTADTIESLQDKEEIEKKSAQNKNG